MYQQYFGFASKPFENTPDPGRFFMGKQYRESLAVLIHSVLSRKALTVITGDIGLGKTTLGRTLLDKLPENTIRVEIIHPRGEPGELLGYVARAMGVEPEGRSHFERVDALRDALTGHAAADGRCVLLIDESQLLTDEHFEEIRLLTNLETADLKLIQIILLGQLELLHKLTRPNMRPLRQRIAVIKQLKPMSPESTGLYVQSRVEGAGANPELFPAATLSEVFRYSRGIPRLINQLCDFALVYAFGGERDRVTVEDVRDAAGDIGLRGDQTSAYVPTGQTSPPSRPAPAPVPRPAAPAPTPRPAEPAPISTPAPAPEPAPEPVPAPEPTPTAPPEPEPAPAPEPDRPQSLEESLIEASRPSPTPSQPFAPSAARPTARLPEPDDQPPEAREEAGKRSLSGKLLAVIILALALGGVLYWLDRQGVINLPLMQEPVPPASTTAPAGKEADMGADKSAVQGTEQPGGGGPSTPTGQTAPPGAGSDAGGTNGSQSVRAPVAQEESSEQGTAPDQEASAPAPAATPESAPAGDITPRTVETWQGSATPSLGGGEGAVHQAQGRPPGAVTPSTPSTTPRDPDQGIQKKKAGSS